MKIIILFRKRFKKRNTGHFYDQVSKYREIIKIIFKSDGFAWSKPVEDDFKKMRSVVFWETRR